tara:strand:+ start:256 stop:384 length:129 start_codon:yes stop_codon:yes gene_type:complete
MATKLAEIRQRRPLGSIAEEEAVVMSEVFAGQPIPFIQEGEM